MAQGTTAKACKQEPADRPVIEILRNAAV